MAKQEPTMGQMLSQLMKAGQKVLADDGSLNKFHDTVMKFFVKLSPHLTMQDMKDAPKDIPILLVLSQDEVPVVGKWQEYDATLGEGPDEDGATGFWSYCEDILSEHLADVRDPVGWFALPDDLQLIAQAKKEPEGHA